MAKQNPFPALLADAMEQAGWQIDGATGSDVVVRAYDAVILHWPDHFSTTRSLPVAWMRTAILFAIIAWQKARGARVIRILHNVGEHKEFRPRLRALNRRLSLGFTDAYVFMSKTSRDVFLERFPTQGTKPKVDLFHPRFGDLPDVSDIVFTRNGSVLRYVGDLRPYKGLDAFLSLVADRGGGVALEIIGTSEDRAYGEVIRAAIATARARGAHVSWEDRRPEINEMTALIASAGCLLLPYRHSWNSGLAIQALELRTPILCSDQPIFRELEADLGPAWVQCYAEDGSDLLERIDQIRNSTLEPGDIEALHLFLEGMNWPRFAEGLSVLATSRA